MWRGALSVVPGGELGDGRSPEQQLWSSHLAVGEAAPPCAFSMFLQGSPFLLAAQQVLLVVLQRSGPVSHFPLSSTSRSFLVLLAGPDQA